jgi:hypothetical protein
MSKNNVICIDSMMVLTANRNHNTDPKSQESNPMNDQETQKLNSSDAADPIVMLPDFVVRMKEGVEHIKKAQQIFARGPLDFYLVKLIEHSEALLTIFAPIKIGERAIITGKIPCNGGWKGSEKNLAVGVEGTVTNVDYRDGSFIYEFVPDVQVYEYNGEWRESSHKASYMLWDKWLHPAAKQ